MFKKIFGKFEKKSTNRIVNYYTLYGYSQYCWANFLFSKKALNYYYNTAPVYKAVNLVANLLSGLPFMLKNKNGDDIEEHSLLNLLRKPSGDITEKEFKFQYAVNMQVMGNNFNLTSPIGTGISNTRIKNPKEPIKLENISPVQIDWDTKNQKGKVKFYTRQITNNGKIRYDLNEVIVGNKDPQAIDLYLDNKSNLLWHSKLYNPDPSVAWGLSPLMSLILSMDSYNESGNHNVNLLRNGARPTGILSYKGEGEMTKDTYDQVKRAFENCHTGSNNAGKIVALDGDFDYEQISINPKDMDWLKGKAMSKEDIYLTLGIPLALVESRASTFNNYFTALYSLYEHTVFPLMDKIIGELSDMLLWRYKDGDDLVLTYSKENIPSLDAVQTESTLNKSKAGIYTINELREMEGLAPLPNGEGDVIANIFSQNAPIGGGENMEEEVINNATKAFRKTLKNAGFSEKQILKTVKELKKSDG